MSNTTKPSTDELVLQLFNTVKQKQKEIAASERPQWETTCTIGTSETDVKDRVNIQTATDTGRLLDIATFLLIKQDYFTKAEEAIGVKGSKLKWMGYTVDQWLKDLRTRVAQIAVTDKRAELKTLEARLDALITTEQRRELELAAIQKELGL